MRLFSLFCRFARKSPSGCPDVGVLLVLISNLVAVLVIHLVKNLFFKLIKGYSKVVERHDNESPIITQLYFSRILLISCRWILDEYIMTPSLIDISSSVDLAVDILYQLDKVFIWTLIKEELCSIIYELLIVHISDDL